MKIFRLPEEDWDFAIILDACRYDSFESNYQDYFDEGSLDKIRGASCTTEWLRTVFRKKYPEIVYVSGNPWVNSFASWDGFEPFNKFGKILDVWKDKWDEENKTVPPEEVTRAAIYANQCYPERRLIIHYLQPHYPYLSGSVPSDVEMYFDGVDGKDGRNNGKFSKFFTFVKEKLEQTLGRESFWKFRKYFNTKSSCIEEYLWRKYSVEELKELYVENLRRVLEEVGTLLNHLDGKIIVTSDHGEALGEKGDFFHPYGTNNPAVREIPYWKKQI